MNRSAALDREIARINKQHVDAGTRIGEVRRAKVIAKCIEEPAAPPLDSTWCSRCGFAIEDHDSLAVRLGLT